MLAFLVFLIGYTLSQFYRSFLAVVAPELSGELHLSASDLGNISAAWFATFALAQFWVGAALDRHGPRRTVPLLMLAGVAGAILFSRAQSAETAIAAMGLIGIGCSPGLMAPLYVFARNYPQTRFAQLSALIIGLGSFGNLLGGTPLALATEAFGWRGVFHGLALVTLASAVIIYLLIADPPRLEAGDHADNGGILSGVKQVAALRELWPVWPLVAVSYAILITERGLWVGPYLSEVHALAPVARGNVIFLMAAAIVGGALAFGPLETLIGRGKILVLPASLIAGAALLVLGYVPAPSIALATVMLMVIGFAGMTFGPLMAHIRSFLPDRLLGRGMTIANFLFIGGAGMIQRWSGYYVEEMRAAGLAPPDLYARLHFDFAIILIGCAAVYAFSRQSRAAA